jgi:hypothetical protein
VTILRLGRPRPAFHRLFGIAAPSFTDPLESCSDHWQVTVLAPILLPVDPSETSNLPDPDVNLACGWTCLHDCLDQFNLFGFLAHP